VLEQEKVTGQVKLKGNGAKGQVRVEEREIQGPVSPGAPPQVEAAPGWLAGWGVGRGEPPCSRGRHR